MPRKTGSKQSEPLDESDLEEENGDEGGEEGAPFDPTQIRIDVKSLTLDLLMSRIKHGELDLSPAFQRNKEIWNKTNQSRLIESLLIRIPLPSFYMDATNEDHWVVVDGLQRLNVFRKFILDDEFRLVGLEYLSEFNKKTFSELPRNLQRRIMETQVTINQIQAGTPENVKFNIFKRINTGGEPLSAQEIRHALYQGKSTEFLFRLTNLPEFQNFWGDTSNKRMQDKEFALRFLAFTMTPYTEYQTKDMDTFLNNALKRMNQASAESLSELERTFIKALDLGYALFGENAFRKLSRNGRRNPVNRALFESWAVTLGKLSSLESDDIIQKKDLLQDKFLDLLEKDETFVNSITFATGDVARVHYRFSAVEKLVSGVVIDWL